MIKPQVSLIRTMVRRFCLSVGTAGAAMGAVQATDLPRAPTVVSGSVSVNSAGNTMDIGQHSDRAIVNWDSFSIGAEHAVNIAQPSASSVILNRVTGQDPSQIMGSLTANGIVLLVNRNGVYFSRSAKVDVGSLVASTSDVADGDVLEGRLRFSGSGSGVIENAGSIRVADGGLAALVAPSVANSGVIRARVGRVALASGDRFNVDLYGDGLIKFELTDEVLDGLHSGDGASLRTVLNQTGTISAEGGEVLLLASTASNIVDSLVNIGGIVEARSVNAQGGRIILSGGNGEVNVAGSLDVSSADGQGGVIEVTGADVALSSTAELIASGAQQGGRIRIGGGYQGGEGLQSASTASVAEGARIDASSREGKGGDVVVWSDDHTRFSGTILASGAGSQGGDVEVSGKKLLEFLGDVQAGAGGKLLLDPENVFIRVLGSPDVENASVIAAAEINRLLRSGTNVVIDATNDIRVEQAINGIPTTPGTASGNLTLDAGNSIVILRPIGTASLDGSGGAITLDAATGNIELRAEAFLFVASANDASHAGTSAITLNAGGSVAAAGQMFTLGRVSLTAMTGNVHIAQTLGGIQGDPGIGSLAVDAGGTVTMNGVYARGAGLASGESAVSIEAVGGIENGIGASQAESIIADAGEIVLAAGNGMTLSGRGATPVAIEARGSNASVRLVNSGASGVGALGLRGSVIAQDGDVAIGSAANSFATVTMNAGTVIQALAATASTPDSGISVYASGAVTAEQLIAARGGEVHITSSNGSVTINGDVTGVAAGAEGSGVGSLVVSAGAEATVNGVFVNGSSGQNAIDISALGGITAVDPLIARNGNVRVASGGQLRVGAISAAGVDGSIEIGHLGTQSSAATITGSLVTGGGNISVGAAENRFASITMDADQLQARSVAGTQAVQTGGVGFFASGNIAVNDVAAGTQGSVVLDSSTGNVTVNEAISGIDKAGEAAGVGKIAITAGGNVEVYGGLALGIAGDATGIEISAGTATTVALLNNVGALISDANVILSSSGKMTLDGAGDTAVAARNEGASITLTRLGNDPTVSGALAELELNGDLITNEGNIAIGTAANPFSSVVAAAGADLQTFVVPEEGDPQAVDGDISIYANGVIDVGAVAGGTASDVRIASLNGSVNLREQIDGHQRIETVAGQPTEVAQGIGSLWVSAQNEIIYNGAFTRGANSSAAAGAEAVGGFASNHEFSIVLAANDRVQILGQTRARGDVYFGNPEEIFPQQTTDIFLNHNVFTGGGAITFAGDTSLFRWAPFGSEDSFAIDLLQLLGIEATSAGDYSYDELFSSGRFTPSDSSSVGFGGTRDGNRRPQCGRDTRILCWPGLVEALAAQFAPNAVGLDTPLYYDSANDNWVLEFVAAQDVAGLDSSWIRVDVANYSAAGNLPLFAFTTSDFEVVTRANLSLPSGQYLIDGFDQGSFTALEGELLSDLISRLTPAFRTSIISDGVDRVRFLRNLGGVMQVTIDTTGVGTGPIDFRGDVRPGVYESELLQSTQWSQAAHRVPRSYVNQELVLRTDDAIHVRGAVGDSDALNFAGLFDANNDGDLTARFAGGSTTGREIDPLASLTLTGSDKQPLVGSFGIQVVSSPGTDIEMRVDSGAVHLHRLSCTDCDLTLTSNSFAASSTVLDDQNVSIDQGAAFPGFQYFADALDRQGAVFTASGIHLEAVNLLTRPGAGSGTARARIDVNTSGGYIGANLISDLSASPFVQPGVLTGTQSQFGTFASGSVPGDLSGGSIVGLPSQAEEGFREQSAQNSTEVHEEDSQGEQCPRGSAGYADLGSREGKSGAPADVFVLCSNDMPSAENRQP
jgi:filamentous hemagglutinin family protein